MGAVVAPVVESEQVVADIKPETAAAATGKDVVWFAATGRFPAAPVAAWRGAEFVKQHFIDDSHAGTSNMKACCSCR
jgi:hypothetical protein